MKRALLGFAVMAMLVGPPFAGTSSAAAPEPGVYTATFTCQHGTETSSVAFNLSAFGASQLTDDIQLVCSSPGTRSVKFVFSTNGNVEAEFVNVVGWTVSDEGCSTGASSGFLSYRESCDAASGGSKLVIR